MGPELTPRSVVTDGGLRQRMSPSLTRTDELAMVCFSCGRSGHGVSQCPRIDATFPILLSGWSVEHRDGQYRAVLQKRTPGSLSVRKQRLIQAGGGGGGVGSASRISNISRPTDPGGGSSAASKRGNEPVWTLPPAVP